MELDTKHANHTCGLCGDFNGIPIYDEFLSESELPRVTFFGYAANEMFLHLIKFKGSEIPTQKFIFAAKYVFKPSSVLHSSFDWFH